MELIPVRHAYMFHSCLTMQPFRLHSEALIIFLFIWDCRVSRNNYAARSHYQPYPHARPSRLSCRDYPLRSCRHSCLIPLWRNTDLTTQAFETPVMPPDKDGAQRNQVMSVLTVPPETESKIMLARHRYFYTSYAFR